MAFARVSATYLSPEATPISDYFVPHRATDSFLYTWLFSDLRKRETMNFLKNIVH